MWLVNLKNTLSLIRKRPHDRILRYEPKEQHLNNKYYITAFYILYSTYFYSYVITIIVY